MKEEEINQIIKASNKRKENHEIQQILSLSKQYLQMEQKKKGLRPFGSRPVNSQLSEYARPKGSFLDKRDEKLPGVYRELQEVNPDTPMNINVGSKWVANLEVAKIKRRRWRHSFINGTFVQEAFIQGKMGVDAFFVIFGVIGVFILPFLFYRRFKESQAWVKEVKGIDKKVLPVLGMCEKLGFELDDISVHAQFDNEKDYIFQKNLKDNYIRNKQIIDLEEAAYNAIPENMNKDAVLKD